ncbi:hypothetical protein ACPPVS_10400 [Cellulomonas sp. McL0617]|uniref:hypothetical protein n=1 Tax=Cellulomonas sp. McL0617 TaxID=3415675 RepID=UPI003CE96057
MGSDVHLDGHLDSIGPVSINPVTVDGIPNAFTITVGSPMPKIQLGVDPVTLNPVNATLTLNPVTLNPVNLNLAVTELPETRAHIPADFTVGLSLLGMDLMSIRLCGEAQMISEAYRPGPCEQCGYTERDAFLDAQDG